jgi:hypothetical protein
LPTKEHDDAAGCELFEETDITLIVDYLTMLSGVDVRMPLFKGNYPLVYVYGTSNVVLHLTANLRTPIHIKEEVISQSAVQRDGPYVFPATIAHDGLAMTPIVIKNGDVKAPRMKCKLNILALLLNGYMFERPCYLVEFIFIGVVHLCQGSFYFSLV